MKLENRFTVPVPRDEAWKVLLDVERIAPCLPGAKVLSRDGDSFTGQVKVKLGPINLTYGGQAKFVELDEAGGRAVIDAQGKETRGTGTAKATITCRLIDHGATTDIEVDTDLAITGKPAQFGRGVLADVSSKLVDQFAACLAEEIQEGTPTEAPAAPSATETTGPPPTTGLGIATEQAVHAGDTESALAGGATVGTTAPAAADSPRETDPYAAEAAKAAATVGSSPSGTSTSAPRAPRAPRQQAEAIDLLGTAGGPVAKRLVPALAVVALVALLIRVLRR
jgi:carbon monoxide dehydrogenase subunit G